MEGQGKKALGLELVLYFFYDKAIFGYFHGEIYFFDLVL